MISMKNNLCDKLILVKAETAQPPLLYGVKKLQSGGQEI